ncbi:MAG: hypothetical protein CMJ81_09260 [Planctomycetaceae bacterium]|nr:hypothetical protein [Planctomycetaceae bacterium]
MNFQRIAVGVSVVPLSGVLVLNPQARADWGNWRSHGGQAVAEVSSARCRDARLSDHVPEKAKRSVCRQSIDQPRSRAQFVLRGLRDGQTYPMKVTVLVERGKKTRNNSKIVQLETSRTMHLALDLKKI